MEFLEAKQDVGLVHGLEIEVGSNDAVAVDGHVALVGTNFGSIRSLDGRGIGGCGG